MAEKCNDPEGCALPGKAKEILDQGFGPYGHQDKALERACRVLDIDPKAVQKQVVDELKVKIKAGGK